MTKGARLALLAAVVVVAVAGFIVLKPSDNAKQSSSVAHVTVKGGKPVGGIKKITVKKGDTVRFVVTSDVGDEIHVHTYDFHKEVTPGGTVSFSFPAKIDGVFVIELEKRAQQIISLEVQP
jgi:plastocyanin